MRTASTIVVLMCVLLLLSSACSSSNTPAPEAPSDYTSRTLEGITFSYPSNWSEDTSEIEMNVQAYLPNWANAFSLASWKDPSDSAWLWVTSWYPDYNQSQGLHTEDDRGPYATQLTMGATALLGKATILSQEKTIVANEWAFETEFSVMSNQKKGCVLVVFDDYSAYYFMYSADEDDWDVLGDVYSRIKSSITFD